MHILPNKSPILSQVTTESKNRGTVTRNLSLIINNSDTVINKHGRRKGGGLAPLRFLKY